MIAGNNTPLSSDVFLQEVDEDEPDGMWPVRELVGSLILLANKTRPDISNVVRAIARSAHAPKLKHWKAARFILQYLIVTGSYGVTFHRGSSLELMVYVDAAFAPNDAKRKTILGVAVISGDVDIQWISRMQNCTTTSSIEAEYVAMAEF